MHRAVEQRATSRRLGLTAHPGSHDSEGMGWASPHLPLAAVPQRRSWQVAGVVPGAVLSLSEVSSMAGIPFKPPFVALLLLTSPVLYQAPTLLHWVSPWPVSAESGHAPVLTQRRQLIPVLAPSPRGPLPAR
ncbi:hypothetical protein MRX96_047398 [Rhipicephalus microplus]